MILEYDKATWTLRVYIRDVVYIYREFSPFHYNRVKGYRSTAKRFRYLKAWDGRMERRKVRVGI